MMTIDDIQARFLYFAAHPDEGKAFCRSADTLLALCEAEQSVRKMSLPQIGV